MGPRADGGRGGGGTGVWCWRCSGDHPRLMGKRGGQEGLICAVCGPARTWGPALKVGSGYRLGKALQEG